MATTDPVQIVALAIGHAGVGDQHDPLDNVLDNLDPTEAAEIAVSALEASGYPLGPYQPERDERRP